MKKHLFVQVFTLLMKNYVNKFLGEKFKNRNKLIQSETPGQHKKNRDCTGKTGTIGMFVEVFCDRAVLEKFAKYIKNICDGDIFSTPSQVFSSELLESLWSSYTVDYLWGVNSSQILNFCLETYSELCKTFKIKLFTKIVDPRWLTGFWLRLYVLAFRYFQKSHSKQSPSYRTPDEIKLYKFLH